MRWLMGCALAGALVGCTSSPTLYGQATAFHDPAIEAPGQTFAVMTSPGQTRSLAFKRYADTVREALTHQGYQAVPWLQADYLVYIGYGISGPQHRTASVPIVGPTGVTSATTYGATTTYTPSYGLVGAMPVSQTTYHRSLKVEMVDDDDRPVYQGALVSDGTTGQLARVLPTMLRGLLSDFPGEDGQTRRVAVPLR